MYFHRDQEGYQFFRKEKRFERDLEKAMILSKNVERDKDHGQYITAKYWIIIRGHLLKTFGEIPNSYVAGLEGFFILEPSIDDEPDEIMETYKNRVLAEKFNRDLK